VSKLTQPLTPSFANSDKYRPEFVDDDGCNLINMIRLKLNLPKVTHSNLNKLRLPMVRVTN
jgi:hypothetical protein